jgi:hypothetical protein
LKIYRGGVVFVDQAERQDGIVIGYLFKYFLNHHFKVEIGQISFMSFVEIVENPKKSELILLNHFVKPYEKFDNLAIDLFFILLTDYQALGS